MQVRKAVFAAENSASETGRIRPAARRPSTCP